MCLEHQEQVLPKIFTEECEKIKLEELVGIV